MGKQVKKFNAKAGPSKAVIRRFMGAAHDGNVAALERAVKKYPDAVHWRDSVQYTALHHAAGAGQADAVTYLLDHGADIEARNTDDGMWGGITPLMCAAEWEKNIDAAKVLAARGADMNACNSQGETALMRAAKYSMYTVNQDKGGKMLRTLVELGADPARKDTSGRTAIDHCSSTADGAKAMKAIREAATAQVERRRRATQADHRRQQSEISDAFTDGLAQPAAILKPVKLRKKPPNGPSR